MTSAPRAVGEGRVSVISLPSVLCRDREVRAAGVFGGLGPWQALVTEKYLGLEAGFRRTLDGNGNGLCDLRLLRVSLVKCGEMIRHRSSIAILEFEVCWTREDAVWLRDRWALVDISFRHGVTASMFPCRLSLGVRATTLKDTSRERRLNAA